MCQNYQDNGSEILCQVPSTQFDSPLEQYCSTDHTDPPALYTEDGCNCALQVPDTSTGLDYELIPAKDLYFGRGECNSKIHHTLK